MVIGNSTKKVLQVWHQKIAIATIAKSAWITGDTHTRRTTQALQAVLSLQGFWKFLEAAPEKYVCYCMEYIHVGNGDSTDADIIASSVMWVLENTPIVMSFNIWMQHNTRTQM